MLTAFSFFYASISRAVRRRSPEPEGLGQPAAAAVLQKSLGFGAGDVAGDEDDAPRHVGMRRDSFR